MDTTLRPVIARKYRSRNELRIGQGAASVLESDAES